jgi:phage baseplate assembly protein W
MTGDGAALFGRGTSFPVRIGTDGRVAWSTGDDNVRESIRTILLTDPGERIMLPDFGGGLRTFLFEPNTPATHALMEDRITRALRRWEPRITVTGVSVLEDANEPEQANVTIAYELVATARTDQLDLAVRLTG